MHSKHSSQHHIWLPPRGVGFELFPTSCCYNTPKAYSAPIVRLRRANTERAQSGRRVVDRLFFAHRPKLDLKSRQAGVAREVPRCPAPRDRRRRILMRHGHPNCPSPRGCKEGKEDSHTAQHRMHLLERLRMKSSEQSPSILQILRHLHHLYRQNCQLLPTICTAAAAAAALKSAANGNVAMQISGELTRCLWTA